MTTTTTEDAQGLAQAGATRFDTMTIRGQVHKNTIYFAVKDVTCPLAPGQAWRLPQTGEIFILDTNDTVWNDGFTWRVERGQRNTSPGEFEPEPGNFTKPTTNPIAERVAVLDYTPEQWAKQPRTPDPSVRTLDDLFDDVIKTIAIVDQAPAPQPQPKKKREISNFAAVALLLFLWSGFLASIVLALAAYMYFDRTI